MDYNILIGGAAGQGVETLSFRYALETKSFFLTQMNWIA
ncbi:MAG: hypothetical protein PWR01_494 [Clostridiales bacterium]|nr:hypothetical protein [Clostridiales bacterium]